MALARPAYRPRDAERGVLHIVVRTHLDTFLREAARCAEGGGLPHRLRYLLAWDHRLCRAVLGVFIRALLDFYHRQGRRVGVGDGHTGTLTVIQRFGGGLNLNGRSRYLPLSSVRDH